jgi:outer membrane protein OmpU
MKNVLFATTALVLTAGVASAEVTFSGAAGAGVSQTKGADMTVWSGIDLDVAASATTDSGMTVSVAEDFGGGSLADYNDDYAIEAQTSDFDTPTITIAMGATTVTLEEEAIDDLYSDAQQGDIGVSTSFGDATVALTLDTRSDETDCVLSAANAALATAPDCDATTGTVTDDAQYSYSLGYTMSGVSVSLTGTDSDDNGNAAMKVGASYAMGNITVGVTSDDKGQNGNDRVNELTASYVAGPATISVAAADDDSWSASVAYTAGAVSVNFGTDNNEEWDANVAYDLGGGVSLKAATNHAEYVAAGINFTF